MTVTNSDIISLVYQRNSLLIGITELLKSVNMVNRDVDCLDGSDALMMLTDLTDDFNSGRCMTLYPMQTEKHSG